MAQSNNKLLNSVLKNNQALQDITPHNSVAYQKALLYEDQLISDYSILRDKHLNIFSSGRQARLVHHERTGRVGNAPMKFR